MDKFLQQFLMFLAESTDEGAPNGGGGSPEDDESTSGENNEDPTGSDELGEGGKKALQAERDARKQADKKVAELEAQIAQAGTESEATVQAAQEVAQQAQDEAQRAQSEATRYRVAARFGISAEPGEDDALSDAEMFLTGSTEEELIGQAQRLASYRKASLDDGLVDLTQGGGGRPAPAEPEPGASRLAAAFDAQLTSK